MNNHNPLKTAVLLITYRRLDTTQQVFEAIRKAKPPKLYISSNIGKNEEDNKKVQLVRAFLDKNIDWDCEVKKLYRTEHLSAKSSISGAIDWFFENEEMGIILEDDCLPSKSFFWFCEELLEKYKDDSRIWCIDGANFQNFNSKFSYDFSKYTLIWGWASWRKAWKNYDVNISKFPQFKENNIINSVWEDKRIKKYWLDRFNDVYENKIDTWDYQWIFTIWINGGLVIRPKLNMIKNIGFSSDGTNIQKATPLFKKMQARDIEISIYHPTFIIQNKQMDYNCSKVRFRIKPLFYKVIDKLFK